jgi:hypothetical protein
VVDVFNYVTNWMTSRVYDVSEYEYASLSGYGDVKPQRSRQTFQKCVSVHVGKQLKGI